MSKKPSTKPMAKGRSASTPPVGVKETKARQKARRIIQRALNGDVEALLIILKATGELPEDYELKY